MIDNNKLNFRYNALHSTFKAAIINIFIIPVYQMAM